MSTLHIIMDIDESPRPHLHSRRLIPTGDVTIAGIPKGMQSGRSCVAIVSETSDNGYVFLEISMVNFIRAAVAMHGRYEKEWRDQGVIMEVTPAPPGAQ